METSKRLLTLQNPAGLIGKPSSKIKNDPQAPEPVNTGDLKEIKLSWPDPLLIQLPAEELKSSLLWVTFKNLSSWDEIVSKDLDQIRNLFDEIEKKSSFVDILETAGKAKGVQIFIGSKNFLFKHSGLSMVMAPYKNNDQEIIGAIGVVGPTRLNYSKIVPLVDYTSKIIGKVID